MRGVCPLLVFAVLLKANFALGQEVTVSTGPGQIGCTNSFQMPNGATMTSGQVTGSIADWHALIDNSAVFATLNKTRDFAYGWCAQNQPRAGTPPVMVVHIYARNSSLNPIDAWWFRGDNQWRITNNVNTLISQEQQRIAAQKQREEEAKQAQLAADTKERVKQAALADCGPAPNISGGPWFSSTYKTAATDAARNSQSLCVKTVEYIGAAVNPFGGNAARAKFTGYDSINYQALSVVRDFPY
jgi:hypothetical protein